MHTCPKCGGIITNDEAKFCRYCGTPLSATTSEETTSTNASPTSASPTSASPLNTSSTGAPNHKPSPGESTRKRNKFPLLFVILLVAGLIMTAGMTCVVKYFLLDSHRYESYEPVDASNSYDSLMVEPAKDAEEAMAESDMEDYSQPTSVSEVNKYWNLTGYMEDSAGQWPVALSFQQNGDELTDCIYTNLTIGGKIRMTGYHDSYGYHFEGKDGRNRFTIDIAPDYYNTEFNGESKDGNKVMPTHFEEI